METRNITITTETAKEMFDSGIESLKQMAVDTYPEIFAQHDYEQIKTWDDVCKKLQLAESVSHPTVKLEYIFEAVRGTKQVVFNGDDYQYYICWNMIENRFGYSYCRDSYSYVPVRMCCPTDEMIHHIVKYFEAECREYFVGS